jgi:hypothetical protein
VVKITRIDDSGAATATIELDEFTVEILYSGIAQMLQAAAGTAQPSPPPTLSRDARQRRDKILARLKS